MTNKESPCLSHYSMSSSIAHDLTINSSLGNILSFRYTQLQLNDKPAMMVFAFCGYKCSLLVS